MNAVTVDEAVALTVAAAPETRTRTLRLGKACGRVLAEPIAATRDQPPFDASAMDGYAVAALPEPGEHLQIIGESQAGCAFTGKMAVGETVRIFTGAPMPAGAARVLLQELVAVEGGIIALKPGAELCEKHHVRSRGGDFRDGEVLLAPGETLDPWKLSLAAATGAREVVVARKPRISVICAGDELVAPGGAPRPDQVYESTSVALLALIETWGGKARFNGVGGDSAHDLARRLRPSKADLIVTVGGASVGDYDLVRPAVDDLGAEWAFEKVLMRPGKPVGLARLGDGRPVLCLPGNPAAALVCAQLFLRSFIRAALGATTAPLISALPCAADLAANGPRESFLRARVVTGDDGRPELDVFSQQDSSLISVFARADALVRRPANAPAVRAGETCACIFLRQ